MLRDITLGQFFPGNTFIHRLDPRTKLLAVILYIVALFNAQGVVTYAIVAALLALCIIVSRVPFRSLTRGLKPIWVIVARTTSSVMTRMGDDTRSRKISAMRRSMSPIVSVSSSGRRLRMSSR